MRAGWERFDALVARSAGVEGNTVWSGPVRDWAQGLAPQLPSSVLVHDDAAAHHAASLLGVDGFACGNRIYLRAGLGDRTDAVMRHELVHVAQTQVAVHSNRVACPVEVEAEAVSVSRRPVAVPVACGAGPGQLLPLFPLLIAAGVGLYYLLRSNPANAPGPGDAVFPRTSELEIMGEAIAVVAIPGGMMKLGARLGFGFLTSSALGGAAGSGTLRAVGDLGRGEASTPQLYIRDMATGALLGFVVPGGLRLIGQVGTQSLDRLAAYGLSTEQIAVVKAISAEGAVNAEQSRQMLMSRGMAGQVSQWYLDKRNLILLYRGQQVPTPEILGPYAREHGIAASEQLLAALRRELMSDVDIASESARHQGQVVPPGMPGAGQPASAIGIPVSGIPGIAAGFGQNGVVYVLTVPRSLVVRPIPWQNLVAEDEWTIFNRVPRGTIVRIIPVDRIAPLTVDQSGLLRPGYQAPP